MEGVLQTCVFVLVSKVISGKLPYWERKSRSATCRTGYSIHRVGAAGIEPTTLRVRALTETKIVHKSHVYLLPIAIILRPLYPTAGLSPNPAYKEFNGEIE
jgi:hypothetical protein